MRKMRKVLRIRKNKPSRLVARSMEYPASSARETNRVVNKFVEFEFEFKSRFYYSKLICRDFFLESLKIPD